MQTVSSMQTSINTSKLPAVWKKLNLGYIARFKYPTPISIVDYGSGRYETVRQVTLFLMDTHDNTTGVLYLPYDPYWGDLDENNKAISRLCQQKKVDLCVCANVLNVIDDLSTINTIVQNVTQARFWVFQIYEGDKSRQGQYTKNHTCYQRNEPIQDYQALVEIVTGGKVYRRGNIITNSPNIVNKKRI